MNPIEFSGSLLAIFVGALTLQSGPAQQATPPAEQKGLERVAPQSEDPGRRDLSRVFGREFDRASWQERLKTQDLDQREQSYRELLQRARIDPVARAFLEDLAHDPQGGELAWTARLALRELGRAHSPFQSWLGSDPLGRGSMLDQMLQDLMSQDESALSLRHRLAPRPPASDSSARRVEVHQTDQGARVDIVETVDGQEQRRTYEGDSLDQILAQNPDLEKDLRGVGIQAAGPLDLRLDLGVMGASPFAADPFSGRMLDPGTYGLDLRPQVRSLPLRTDKLGVIVRKLTPQRATELGLKDQGLYVERTYPETYAQLLGVGTGDILLALNGTPLREIDDIDTVIGARAKDQELVVTWLDELGQRQRKTWRPAPAPK